MKQMIQLYVTNLAYASRNRPTSQTVATCWLIGNQSKFNQRIELCIIHILCENCKPGHFSNTLFKMK